MEIIDHKLFVMGINLSNNQFPDEEVVGALHVQEQPRCWGLLSMSYPSKDL